jgi:hypothetical protein
MRGSETNGLEGSVGGSVGQRVQELLDAAAADAEAITRAAGEEAEAVAADARRDAGDVREAVRRAVAAEATARVERLARLRQQIVDRGEALVDTSDHPDELRARLQALAAALADAAELIGREAAGVPQPAGAAAPAAAADEPAETVRGRSVFGGWERRRLDAIRLEALREAVAGAGRETLTERLAPVVGDDVARAVLDDVFGCAHGEASVARA